MTEMEIGESFYASLQTQLKEIVIDWSRNIENIINISLIHSIVTTQW